MEATGWNLQECSVRLWRYDRDTHRNATRAERGIFAKPHEPVALTALQAPNHDLGYDGVPVTVKLERDDEDVITTEKPEVGHIYLWEHSDIDLFVKKEIDTVRTKENEMDETMIKQELDIGPTVLQPQTAPLPLLPPIQDDPSNSRPSTGSWGVAASAPLYAIFAQLASGTVVDNGDCEDYEVLSNASYVLDMEGATDPYQKVLRKHFHDCLEIEDTSVDMKKGDRCSYCVRSLIECNCKTDVARAEVTTHTGGKKYDCDYCEYSMTNRSDLIKHIHTHMSENLYEHNECEYGTFKLRRSKIRMSTYIDKNSYKCEKCDYSTPFWCGLKKHLRTHMDEKPYKCGQCKYSAYQPSHLKRHMHIHTGEKPHKCERCEYSTSQLAHLKRHMRFHTGEKPHKCEQCPYSASESSQLKRHMRSHTGERPYKCEQCAYSASQLGSLKLHMRIHTGEKPYKCKQCEYRTSRLGHLKVHMRVHKRQKPYKYRQREYSKSLLGDLKMRMRIHGSEKPYKRVRGEHGASRVRGLNIPMRPRVDEKPYKWSEYDPLPIGHLKKPLRTYGRKNHMNTSRANAVHLERVIQRHDCTQINEKNFIL